MQKIFAVHVTFSSINTGTWGKIVKSKQSLDIFVPRVSDYMFQSDIWLFSSNTMEITFENMFFKWQKQVTREL